MRFVGSRQEPEEHPVPVSEMLFFPPELPMFVREDCDYFIRRMAEALAVPSVLLNYGDRPR